jgi:hypothetical protein
MREDLGVGWSVLVAVLAGDHRLTERLSLAFDSSSSLERHVRDRFALRPDSLGSRVNILCACIIALEDRGPGSYAHHYCSRGSRSSVLIATMLCNALAASPATTSMLLRSAVRRRSKTGMDRRLRGIVRRILGWPAQPYCTLVSDKS